MYCRRALADDRPAAVDGVRCVYVPTVHTKNLSTIVASFLSSLHALFTRAEVVHLYTVGTALFIPLLRLGGKRVVISVDALDWERKKWSGPARWYMRTAGWLAVRAADELIIDSRRVQEYYRARWGRPGAYVPFGARIDPPLGSAFVTSLGLRSGKYVLFVGVLRPEKQVDHLIRAFTGIRQDDFDLVIVGDDPFEREYEGLLHSLANERVHFVGRIYGEHCAELYQNAYVYVTTSGIEGTSPALLTAMAAGRCVVVNGIAENLETIGQAGLSYPANDVDALCALLARLFAEPEEVQRYGELAIARVKQHYDWDAVAGDFARIYQQVCEPAAARQGAIET